MTKAHNKNKQLETKTDLKIKYIFNYIFYIYINMWRKCTWKHIINLLQIKLSLETKMKTKQKLNDNKLNKQ